MTYKVKTLAEKSWLILTSSGTSAGLLTENRNEFSLILEGLKRKFKNKKELNTFFDFDIAQSLSSAEQLQKEVSCFVRGFPVKGEDLYEIKNHNYNLPLYSKIEHSKVIYSAGYYCIKFPKNWMPAFCPKLATLQAHKYAGPFKTKTELKSNLKVLRKNETR